MTTVAVLCCLADIVVLDCLMFYVFLLLLYEIKSIYYFFLTMYINRSLAMSTAAVWCRVVWSRNVHPCYMVSRCPVSRCPPLLSGAALSGLAMSTLAIWSRVVQSHYVSSHNFDGLVMSGLAFSASPLYYQPRSMGMVFTSFNIAALC